MTRTQVAYVLMIVLVVIAAGGIAVMRYHSSSGVDRRARRAGDLRARQRSSDIPDPRSLGKSSRPRNKSRRR